MRFAKAITKNIRISPRKARLAAGLIRGLNVEEAGVQLKFCRLRSGKLLQKTLDSAVANAEIKLDAKASDLRIHEVRVDAGPTMKRAKARSKGGRTPVMKRTSHFTVIVAGE